MSAEADRAAIRDLLRDLNAAWYPDVAQDAAERIAARFAEDAVIAAGDLRELARGAEACAQSYLDFARTARVREFAAGDANVDLYGDSAVARYEWSIAYAVNGIESTESGSDMFVLARRDSGWKILWRAMLSSPMLAPSPPSDRARGIGGIFLRAREPRELHEWYAQTFGIEQAPFGGLFIRSRDLDGRDALAVLAFFERDDAYFDPAQPTMLNFRVGNLDATLERLLAAGVRVANERQDEPNGRFAWCYDPEGNRVELWEPASGTP